MATTSYAMHFDWAATYETYAFRLACYHGCLREAQQWLVRAPHIDVSSLNEDAFRAACGNHHLDVTQWLLANHPPRTLTKEQYQADIVPLFAQPKQAWVDVATAVLAMQPGWDPVRAQDLGLVNLLE